jgi:hypothetical protein
MSRCYACNCILTTQESVRKFKGSGTFTELCSSCLSTISEEVETVEGAYVEEPEKDDDWDEDVET